MAKKKNKMSLFGGGARGPKKQLGHSCGKLKKSHPQSIKRTTTMHPEALERMSVIQEEQEQEEK